MALMCPNCCKPAPYGNAFCVNCGADLPADSGPAQEIACPDCVTENPATAPVCRKCGAALRRSEPSGTDRFRLERTICALCGTSLPKSEVDKEGRCSECRAVRPASAAATAATPAGALREQARMDERLPTEGCFIKIFRRTSGGVLELLFGSTPKTDLAKLVDISLGGLQCILKRPAKAEERLEIELHLPGHATPIFTTAEVCRAENLPSGHCRAGMRFVAMESAARNKLLSFLQHLSLQTFQKMHGQEE